MMVVCDIMSQNREECEKDNKILLLDALIL